MASNQGHGLPRRSVLCCLRVITGFRHNAGESEGCTTSRYWVTWLWKEVKHPTWAHLGDVILFPAQPSLDLLCQCFQLQSISTVFIYSVSSLDVYTNSHLQAYHSIVLKDMGIVWTSVLRFRIAIVWPLSCVIVVALNFLHIFSYLGVVTACLYLRSGPATRSLAGETPTGCFRFFV